ncbi:MAG: flagellar export protein FliJ [Bdellovibrionales bacterium]|jgi:flagellar FliJ protein|nr:flagellar export protein FliJ [Bdellovibrionales bacterium]
MKFRFRLQKVLEHRQRLEDEAKRDYLKARAATEDALTKLRSMYQAIDDSRTRAQGIQLKENGSALSGVLRMSQSDRLQEIELFIRGQGVRIERHKEAIRSLKIEEEEKQEALVRAAREKKTLEKLREKKLQEFKEEQERREQAEADDLAVMRFGRGEGP